MDSTVSAFTRAGCWHARPSLELDSHPLDGLFCNVDSSWDILREALGGEGRCQVLMQRRSGMVHEPRVSFHVEIP